MIVKKIIFLFFAGLFVSGIHAQCPAPLLKGLKSFSQKDSIYPNYYDPDGFSLFCRVELNPEGSEISYLQMNRTDTVEFTKRLFNEKGQMVESKSRRPHLGDSVIAVQFNGRGEQFHSYCKVFRPVYEFYDPKTEEYKNTVIEDHEINIVYFDDRGNRTKKEKIIFSILENDTLNKPFISAEETNFIYDKNDSVVSMKRKYSGQNYSEFEKIKYGPRGRTSWQSWKHSGYYIDSTAATATYDEKGRRQTQQTIYWRERYGEKSRDKEEIKFFYNDSSRCTGKEISYTDLKTKEKRTEYFSDGSLDSTVYFEKGVRLVKKNQPEDAKLASEPALPPFVFEDGFNEYWRPGATIEFDPEGRLVKLYYDLDGFYQYFEYEWEKDRLSKKIKFRDIESGMKEIEWVYSYEFY